jgi:uncharacterized membrane protein YraQ (UPF0718 family)
MPVLVSLITIPLISSELSSAFNTAIIFIALLIGLLIGFLIGKFMEVQIDEDGSMFLKALEHEMFGACKKSEIFYGCEIENFANIKKP